MNASIETSSQNQRIAVILLIFTIAFIDLVGNLAVFLFATTVKTLQNSFGRLSASQSFAEAILCAVFMCFYCPMVVFEQNTRILIFIAYAIPCFTSIYMHLANHCLLPYVDFGWYFGVNTSASCDVIRFYVDFCKDFGVVSLIAIVDVSTMIMIKVTASRMNSTSSNSLQSQKHRDREIAFVKQCIIQGGVFAAELISFFIISGMQTNPVGIFICTTVAWCSVHSIDPYVLIFLNSELRNMLKKNPIGMTLPKSRKLPPGPITLPLIGNIPQIVYYSWKNNGIVPAFEYFRKKYGNVFTLWLGPFPHVSIADFETNHEVFVKNGNRYKDRFLSPIFEELQDDHGLVFANGEKWAELRKFTMVTFRNMGVRNETMEEKIMEELDARCADLDNEAIDGKTVVEHGKLFELMVGSVINSLLVGKRFGEDNKEEFLHIRHLIETFNEVFTTFDMIMPVWVLKTFFPTRYAIAADGMNTIKDYVGRVAEKRFEEVKSGKYVLEETNPKDYVDAFLIKMQKEKDHPAYTMKSLKYVLLDLWSAGHDTTATTLISGFNQFMHHPEVTSDAPTKVNGYELDAGEILTAQMSALHVNEDIFKHAGEFMPERFLENEKLIHQLIPFGIGKRSCVGENLARAELFLVFGNLLLRYNIQPHGKLPSTADQHPFSAVKIADTSAKLEFIKI
ncbi:hypothetical protein L5515_006630 [Caenorhabditis briggsae]|uniref:7TM GPCR serpentine receptor class x (Srx) domain-containing protein n=1 Tax=Caenorhabditis briggsae TaxID=6238 RepID=A0AAE9EZV7_CAEBR|nr:hypothetical protein L5515_006630 [Caenorhabditis briggsae]